MSLCAAALCLFIVVTPLYAQGARLLDDTEEEDLPLIDGLHLGDNLSRGLGSGFIPAAAREDHGAAFRMSEERILSRTERANAAHGSASRVSHVRRDFLKDALREEGEKIRWRRAPRFTHGIRD